MFLDFTDLYRISSGNREPNTAAGHGECVSETMQSVICTKGYYFVDDQARKAPWVIFLLNYSCSLPFFKIVVEVGVTIQWWKMTQLRTPQWIPHTASTTKTHSPRKKKATLQYQTVNLGWICMKKLRKVLQSSKRNSKCINLWKKPYFLYSLNTTEAFYDLLISTAC